MLRIISTKPSNNVVICAAGGGKTTRIAREALADPSQRVAILTYTDNNIQGIQKCIVEENLVPAAHIEVLSWFTFLLRELTRPYQNVLYTKRVKGIHWVPGRSDKFATPDKVGRYYFGNSDLVYSDKIARFACECDAASGGKVFARLRERFDRIFIDEIQDMAGWDLELLEAMMRAGIKLTLVGDHRQPTFRTNYAGKNSGYGGYKIIKKFREWDERGLCTLEYQSHTHRCNQAITDFADALYKDEPKTESLNKEDTNHDGVFHIRPQDVADYVKAWQPQVLRYDKTNKCAGLPAMNFGISKGMTFDRVLIFPTKVMTAWLTTGDDKHIDGSRAKIYVAVTRARYSVVFVHPDPPGLPGIEAVYSPLALGQS
ncbi:UvrD-helicase domain-containing protein [Rhizobium leguminosarum]|uniref:UvrD-helicase domain-containing protein n=1 Tax=Rhizobium leguminosarum TaxID=384 RepID=UPI001C94EBD5|nr:UvrD-helicase domain-containing protein [Rhizobium leguminosarum]MBY5518302.1 UvrD-helicase domain-containing protein [Rhizobium leguminosarum]